MAAVKYSWILFTSCLLLIISVSNGQVNLALDPAITCQASINPGDCDKITDNISFTSSATFKWDFFNDPVGQWIQLNFPAEISFSYLRIAENNNNEKNLKDIELSFSNPPTQNITLTSRTSGFVWEEFDITRVTTAFIRFTFLSSYGASYSVIAEIEIYDSNPDFTTTTSTTTTTPTTPTTTTTSTTTTTPTTPTTPTTTTPATTTTTPTTTTITSGQPSSAVTTQPASMTSQSSPRNTDTTQSGTTSGQADTTSQEETNTTTPGGDGDGNGDGGGGRIGGATDDDDGDDDKDIFYGIIGAVAGILLVAVIIIIIICCRKCGSKGQKADDEEKLEKTVVNGSTNSGYVELKEIVPEELKSSPILVPDLTSHIQKLSLSEGFKHEFADIPSGELKPTSDAKRQTIVRKNRFNNIFPYNDNRVRLNILDDSDDQDYINASVITGIESRSIYIAAQGPNDLTIDDFYRMIWEKDIPIVVMLANLEEKGKKKCSQYWPDEGSQTFGEIGVKLESVKTFDHWVVRELQLSQITKTGPSAKTITQYHFTTWPDEGVPQTATDVIAFHHVVTKAHGDSAQPMVIHCSAGVGRTGTLIALDSLLHQAHMEGKLDVQRFVHHMRRERMNMVQSLAQYRFIYHCLVEKLHCKHVSIPNEQFAFVLPIILHPEDENPKSVIEQQFNILEIFKHKVGSVVDSEINKDKNRCLNYLPEDDFRPYLANIKEHDTDYISAIFAMSFKDPYGFFVTTMPLSNTITEFWRLVLDYNIRTIVMINEVIDDGLYWPNGDEDEVVFDIVRVKRMRVEDGDVIRTTLEVSLVSDTKRSTEVTHLRLKDSSSERPSAAALLDLYQQAAASRAQCQPVRILVHCMTGVEVSGLFCATDHIVEKIDTEQEVDVFNAVKKIRLTRPSFVPTLDQYKYLYRVADKYLERLQEGADLEGDDEEEAAAEEPIYDNTRPVSQPLPIVTEEEEPEPEVEEDASSVHHLVIDVL